MTLTWFETLNPEQKQAVWSKIQRMIMSSGSPIVLLEHQLEGLKQEILKHGGQIEQYT